MSSERKVAELRRPGGAMNDDEVRVRNFTLSKELLNCLDFELCFWNDL